VGRPRHGQFLLAVTITLTACATPTAPTDPASRAPSSEQTPSGSPAPTATASTAAIAPPDGATTYSVRPGDSLASIARSHGTSAEQLQAWNGERYPTLLTDPDVLEPGWVLIVDAGEHVTPLPSPTPPPTASGCTANNRAPAGSPETFATIPDAGPAVALTFDMGGRMDPAVEIMGFLAANEVCATIFATGVMSETPEGQGVMTIIEANPGLFEIANHTMYHCDLARGGGGSPSTAPCAGGPFDADRIRRELSDAEAILAAATGQDPRPYWRPPYGSTNQAVLDAAASVGYTKTFMWDIDTVDWKPIADGGPSAEQIAARVVNGAVDGSNVLFHLGGYETLDALHLIVPALRDRGFTLTSLSDLLN
jgi:peptidoglycan/xylan/chitin deacetylase (PgdA/CDA1 family)